MSSSLEAVKNAHPLLDVRDQAAYASGHFSHASHFPIDDLAERIHELPTRRTPLYLFGSRQQLDKAKQLLSDKGYHIVACIDADPKLLAAAKKANLLNSGSASVQLWQANALLEEGINEIEQRVSGRIGLDLGCGSGRDVIFLAQRGWKMTGVDYSNNSLDKLKRFANRSQVDVQTVCEDLEQGQLCSDRFQADLILVMRYLHRPLFSSIEEWLKPGGILVYQTFLEAAKFHGKPKNPNFLLKPSELGQRFSDFEIIIDRQDRLADGRPVASFIAQKR